MKPKSFLSVLFAFLTLCLLSYFSIGQVSLPKVAEATVTVDKDSRKAGDRMTITINEVEYAFHWCPAGTFMMGSPEDEPGNKDREMLHQVTLSQGFWILETEVTQAMWGSVMGNNPSEFKGTKLPVESVSWDHCQEYITKLNALKIAPAGFKFALPTEAQWEYACRAGTKTAYSFGDTLTETQANIHNYDKKNFGTKEVGSYPANAWGLYDMHGNVWEWCQDWYGVYPNGAVVDPIGALSGKYRVRRGGSWSYFPSCRSACRGGDLPVNRNGSPGVRVILFPSE